MNLSPFFAELRVSYQSEIDDLMFDSEGHDVLSQRLSDKRGEIGFLVKMMEISPEMVAVVFHRGFEFPLPAVVDNLLTLEADEFPEWDSLSDAVRLKPWARELADIVLQEARGDWFLTVAAGLEYLAGKPLAAGLQDGADEDADDLDEDPEEGSGLAADDEQGDARTRREAGDDWMADQGFDRKE